jgi:O-antigen/teichoic acid export membrane protein
MENLKERTLRGGTAKFIAQAANTLLRVGSLMVLARLLDPKDFGLVGMVAAVTGVFRLFQDAGLSLATVQRSTITKEQISTLFWVNILVGAILSFLSLAIAPILVSFYQEPQLFWVTVTLGVAFLFSAAGVQHLAILQREMRFVALSVIEVFSVVVSTAVGIGMAMIGFGYWALVGMTVMMPITSTACLWLSAAWVPGMPHKSKEIASMMRFGGIVTLNGLVVHIAYNLEKVLLGRFWGAEAVGIYGRAYQLSNFATENINGAVTGVAFSVLSRLQDNPVRFKHYFLRGYSLVLELTLPTTAACALFADDLVLVLLGPKWGDAVLIFRLLTPTILVFAICNPLGWLMQSLGLVGRSLKIALLIAPCMILGYTAGLPYGPNGVAFGYSAMMVLLLIPVVTWARYGTVVSIADIWGVVYRPLFSTIVATALTFTLQSAYLRPEYPLVRLLIEGAFLFATYFCMICFTMGRKDFYWELLRGLKRRSVGIEDKSDTRVA